MLHVPYLFCSSFLPLPLLPCPTILAFCPFTLALSYNPPRSKDSNLPNLSLFQIIFVFVFFSNSNKVPLCCSSQYSFKFQISTFWPSLFHTLIKFSPDILSIYSCYSCSLKVKEFVNFINSFWKDIMEAKRTLYCKKELVIYN